MEFYLQHIRRKIIPLNEFKSRFFLTDSGNEFKSISATVKSIGKLFGYNLPNVTLQRKLVMSKGIKTRNYY